MRTKNMKKETRTRVWVFVGYPESLPQNYIDILTELHVPCCISPLHDKDKNATGEEKKAHYHFILSFSGVKSYDQVKEITESLNATVPQACQNVKGMVRYLTHKDNPEKYQYNEFDIRCLNGFDLEDYLKPTNMDRYQFIDEMVEFVNKSGIVEFCELLDYARLERRKDWFPLLCDSCAIIMREYIKFPFSWMNCKVTFIHHLSNIITM